MAKQSNHQSDMGNANKGTSGQNQTHAHNQGNRGFVAELDDSRLLVVEHKGEVYKTNDDSREKNAVGKLWPRTATVNVSISWQ